MSSSASPIKSWSAKKASTSLSSLYQWVRSKMIDGMKPFLYGLAAAILAWFIFLMMDIFGNTDVDIHRSRELYSIDKLQYETAHPDEIPYMSYYEWLIDQD